MEVKKVCNDTIPYDGVWGKDGNTHCKTKFKSAIHCRCLDLAIPKYPQMFCNCKYPCLP